MRFVSVVVGALVVRIRKRIPVAALAAAALFGTRLATAQMGLIVDGYSAESQVVEMYLVSSYSAESSGSSAPNSAIFPVTGSMNRRGAYVWFASNSAPYNMWTSQAQARRVSCIVEAMSGIANLKMTGRLTEGVARLDYSVEPGSAINLLSHGDAIEVKGVLQSGPLSGQTGFGSYLSLFVEVRDDSGAASRQQVINATGNELVGRMNFPLSQFSGVALDRIRTVSVGLYYRGNDVFDLAYYPPNFVIDSIIVVPVSDADGDEILDHYDNCPSIANPAQSDCNGDGIGDACDASGDFNGNGVPDSCECIGDLFVDGQFNGADLGALLSQWGPATAATASDLNRDGQVNGADLGYLLSGWGPCGN